MATTITYKGSTIATATNQTKTLKTSGKYMEDDVTITDVSSSGSAVVVEDTLDSHGGIIREITAVSLEGDTVSPSVLLNGYTAHNASGEAITGTLVPGGGTVTLQTKSETYTPTTSQQTDTITADTGYDGLEEVDITINAVPTGSVTAPSSISGSSASVTTGTNTLTLTKTVSVTPNVTTAGYISSGTAGNSSVSLTASVNTRSSSDLTASGATVTAPAGFYASQATKTVASGTVTAPSSISGTSASVSTGTNTLTLTKTVSVTPNVTTAGYVSSGTAGNSSVSLTASVTTKGAATITPTTTNQTIASGTYLTGVQTISGDANLVSGNIVSGKSIFGVSGSVVLQAYYTGSSAPSASLGSNGDLYLQS